MNSKCYCGGQIRCGNCGAYEREKTTSRDLIQEMFPNTKDFLEAKNAIGDLDYKIKDALLFLIKGREKEFLEFIQDSKVKKEA